MGDWIKIFGIAPKEESIINRFLIKISNVIAKSKYRTVYMKKEEKEIIAKYFDKSPEQEGIFVLKGDYNVFI